MEGDVSYPAFIVHNFNFYPRPHMEGDSGGAYHIRQHL